MKAFGGLIAILILVAAAIVVYSSAYTVPMSKQVIITQFGKKIGEPITEAGLHFKMPFVQEVNEFEKRILEWDGRPIEMPTKDKLYIIVDTFGRWRISDASQYFVRLRDERSAQSRVEDILGSETRSAVANHELIEIVRTSKEALAVEEDVVLPTVVDGVPVANLLPIAKGRTEIEQEILRKAKTTLLEFGIELLDVRFKRINYNQGVRSKIFDRMISERQQIAERFRSEGAGEAQRILGKKELELKRIESEAYKKIQGIEGGADARATEIYAQAYNESAQSAELYGFLKTMETYRDVIQNDTTLLFSTQTELFRLLKENRPPTAAAARPTVRTPRPVPSEVRPFFAE